MDGENNGRDPIKIDDFGGTIILGNTHIAIMLWIYSINLQDRFFHSSQSLEKKTFWLLFHPKCLPALSSPDRSAENKKKTMVPKLSDFHRVSDSQIVGSKVGSKALCAFVHDQCCFELIIHTWVHTVDGRNPKQPPVIYESV